MGIAIEKCWCGTAHLWCRWHVLRAAQADLGPIFNVGTPFYNNFHKIINDMLTVDEFEMAWDQLLEDYNLRENEFMQRTYNKRKKWAKPYNKGVYCGGMTSTQRSESANHMLKKHVPRNSSMNKFVMNYNNLLLTRYKAEQEAEHETKQNVFVHERAWPIEIHALQVYTNASYKLFSKQVDKSTRYNVRLTNDPSVFLVVHDKAKLRERYARVEFTVHVEDGGGFLECDCGLYSHLGILCCHSIRVMLQLGISRIPDRHIMIRWTRIARDTVPEEMNFYPTEAAPVQPSLTYRHRLLAAIAALMVTEGDHDAETFEIATKHMHRAFMEIADYRKLKQSFESDGYTSKNDGTCSEYGNGTDTDGETGGNMFGAAGSSAGLSDSELLSLRPPDVKIKRGRPRMNRYKGRLDIIKEKMKRSGRKSTKKKKKGKACRTCGLDDHKETECLTKSVVITSTEM